MGAAASTTQRHVYLQCHPLSWATGPVRPSLRPVRPHTRSHPRLPLESRAKRQLERTQVCDVCMCSSSLLPAECCSMIVRLERAASIVVFLFQDTFEFALE